MLLAAIIAAGASVKVYAAKNYATSGGNNSRNILWNYNKRTKTLTISPNNGKKVKKQNLSDLEGWMGHAKKVVYKKGVKSLYPTFYPYGDGTYRPYTNLEEVEITGDIKRIDNNAFDGCENLSRVTLKKGVEYIGSEAFYENSNLNSISFPDSIRYIGDGAFYETNIKKVKFNNKVIYIGEDAFNSDSIEEVELRKVKYIGLWAFVSDNIKKLSFMDDVDYIDSYSYIGGKQIKELFLPEGFKILKSGLYSNMAISKCVIPNSVIQIENRVFRCTELREIIVSRNVEILGKYSLSDKEKGSIVDDCDKLQRIVIKSKKIKKVYPEAMSGISADVTIEVPMGFKDKYTEMFRQGGLPDGVKIEEIEVNDSDLDSVKLNKTKLKIKAKCNRKLELMYTDEPDKVTWKTSDNKIIKVDSSGNARSLKPGKAEITATYKNHKYVCKVTVTKADANNDEVELKKLIKKQRRMGNLYVSTNIHSKQYKWKKGRLVAINWSETEAIGKINLNPFTYLEDFDISEAWDDGYISDLGQYICEIYADDLKYLKKIDLSETFHERDLPDEFIHTENSPNVKILRLTGLEALDKDGY